MRRTRMGHPARWQFLLNLFGEAGDGFVHGLDGAGEHEADGVEEAHAGLVEAAWAARATTSGREPRSIDALLTACAADLQRAGFG